MWPPKKIHSDNIRIQQYLFFNFLSDVATAKLFPLRRIFSLDALPYTALYFGDRHRETQSQAPLWLFSLNMKGLATGLGLGFFHCFRWKGCGLPTSLIVIGDSTYLKSWLKPIIVDPLQMVSQKNGDQIGFISLEVRRFLWVISIYGSYLRTHSRLSLVQPLRIKTSFSILCSFYPTNLVPNDLSTSKYSQKNESWTATVRPTSLHKYKFTFLDTSLWFEMVLPYF